MNPAATIIEGTIDGTARQVSHFPGHRPERSKNAMTRSHAVDQNQLVTTVAAEHTAHQRLDRWRGIAGICVKRWKVLMEALIGVLRGLLRKQVVIDYCGWPAA